MFAQLMSEILSPTAFESFRAYSLGTVARIEEALDLRDDVQADRIPSAALEPALAELVWSLAKDPVAQGMIGSSEYDAFSQLVERKNYSLSLTFRSI